jgi:hypothetical protein
MGSFRHPNSAEETCRTPFEASHDGQPALQPTREEAPDQSGAPIAEWEDLWIDLGGEG